jgi:MFS family permease
MWALAALAGPLLGGTLTDHASWRWIFFVNVPLGLLALAVVLRNMRVPTQRREHHIDWTGAALLTAGVTAMLLACVWGGTTFPWGSPQVVGAAAGGLALVVAFVFLEQRAAEPLLALHLYRERIVAVSAAGSLVIGAVLFGVTIYAPLYVQSVQGASATGSGVILMPLTLAWVAATFFTGQAIARTGRYRVWPVFGSLLTLAGVAALAMVDADTSRTTIAVALAFLGIGMGSSFQPYTIATQNAVGPDQIGVATAGLQFARSMGGSLAVAGLGAVLANRVATELTERLGAGAGRVDVDLLLQGGTRIQADLLEATRAAMADGLAAAFLVLAVLSAVGVALALALEERPLRDTHAG